jgi:hypothetical protein
LGVPSPEEASDEDLRELYGKLYEKAEDQSEQIEELQETLQSSQEKTEDWRRRYWYWRLGSFLPGVIVGFLPSLI